MKESKKFVTYLIKDKKEFTKMYQTLADYSDSRIEDRPSWCLARQTFFKDKKLLFKTYKYANDLYLHDYRDGHEAKYHFEVKA